MGSWGTGISSNDIYEDINYKFFELYNEGMEVSAITERLIKENKELIDSHEDQNNFWITIAKSQWECKALDPKIYNQIEDIVKSEKDIELWKELDASKSDLTKRRKVLENFLEKISTEKKTARKRKVKKKRDAIFQKGDCLIFKLSDGDFCGAFVLESEKESEFGLNLVAVTNIKKSDKPTEQDFKNAKILFGLQQQINKEFKPKEKISWYYAQHYKKAEIEIEKVGQLEVDKSYSSSRHYQSFSNWDNLKLFQDNYYSDLAKNECDVNVPLKSLRKNTSNDIGYVSLWQRVKTKFNL
ncbi:hypothetical protein SAMN05216480_112138 [Pustulibacterium marinum]|uniref:DUF4259 domain-containing protein n=1 Tax=Pustulibacterium marinum TaxID=1224947 RepID=A0A1I7I3M6_9FLAO|nr:hypothetical protein [Pustulibacterium marinum]SFU67504.1 hypothetical protein SAMN05216480_112138 [Pustulibacterium marinum]